MLTECHSPAMLRVGAVSYPIFATWMMAETRKSYWHCGQQVPFHNYYGRDQKIGRYSEYSKWHGVFRRNEKDKATWASGYAIVFGAEKN